MTESDWLSCSSPEPMLAFLRDRGASDRKVRLFGVGCCRRIIHLLTDPRAKTALALVDRHLAGEVSAEVLDSAAAELGRRSKTPGLPATGPRPTRTSVPTPGTPWPRRPSLPSTP